MSINKLISIRNPIMDAIELSGVNHDKFIPKFTRWAELAETEIGSYQQYERKRAVLDINGCVANLPNDAVLVEIAVLGDLGENCENLLGSVCAWGIGATINLSEAGGGNFLIVDIGGAPENSTLWGIRNYYIQNNKIIFDSDNCGQKVTIQYLRYKKDCDGFFEVGQNHVLAITNFIMWKYYISRANPSYIDLRLADKYEMEWHRECAHARAEDGRMSFTERRDAVDIWHNPYTGGGMWQGLYTTLGNNFCIW